MLTTQTFSQKNSIIFGRLVSTLLITLLLTSLISAAGNKNKPKFSEDQCFCGARYAKTKKLNLYLFGPLAASQIVNYIDQSVSKFNGIHMDYTFIKDLYTEKVSILDKSDKNQKYYSKNWKLKNEMVTKNIGVSYFKSLKFNSVNKKNRQITLDFTMAKSVSFEIKITMINGDKNQFDIVATEKLMGNNGLTGIDLRKAKDEFRGYTLRRSLSHFDKNQLDVDVCRFMYVALNQLLRRNFKTSLPEHIVTYNNKKNAIGCSRPVLFKKRFNDDYLTRIIESNFSKSQKDNYTTFRQRLKISKKKNFRKVVQDFSNNENTDQDLAIEINDSEANDFDDNEEFNRKNGQANDQSDISFDQEEDDEEVFETHSSQTSVIETTNDEEHFTSKVIGNENTLNLRNREIIRTPTDNSEPSQISPNGDVLALRNRDIIRPKQKDIMDDSSVSDSMNDVSNKSTHYIVDHMNSSTHSDDSSSSEDIHNVVETIDHNTIVTDELPPMKEPKTRKRVIVLIETVECSKCLNDISVNSFYALLQKESMMI